VQRDEVVTLTGKLVRINTENPPGKTREACETLADELERAGFAIEFVEPVEGFTSLVATYTFPEPGRTLLINGHLDVVPVGATADEWTHDPFGAEIDGDKLYGRGAMDMKGPLAAAVTAACSLVRERLLRRGSLVVTAVADEEEGGKRGTGAVLATGKIHADAAVVVEPSEGGVSVAHRGMCFIQLTTHGKSAHASVPANGVNAVESMVEVLRMCRAIKLRHTSHTILGSPTIAIGTTICGGEKANVIPDRCSATLDVRHVPGMTSDGVLEDLRGHFATCGLPEHQHPDVDVTLWGESAETPPDAEIVRVAADAHRNEFGTLPPLRGERGATDGWWFANRASIPTIMALGPGGVDGVHIVDECIDLVGLGRYARVYADLIARFLR
jgi:acetylornithine deacetylase/succinyl-diaminopimelate desuccinylase family protein